MGNTNLARLKNCMKRAALGETLTIGFLGGSITQGCFATEHKRTYAYQVFSWWKEAFPQAAFSYVNGGIGGTTSHFGVARAVTDVLMYQPDVVMVDFSVNDEANDFFQETYEGLVRRLLTWDSKPAVILLNHVYYDTGANAQEYHNAVGDWYGIPHISIRDTIYQEMRAGRYTREELTADGLHPNDKGHKLAADEITAFLEQVKSHMEDEEAEGAMPDAMTVNAYETARRLTIREISPELSGFRADPREKMGHLDCFKNGWIGKKAGDKIIFQVQASCIAVQYRKTNKEALRAKVVLDSDEESMRILDGHFDEDWECLYLEPILHHGKRMLHRIEIVVLDDGREEGAEFYLLSLIQA